jgi:hypothetical protein
VTDKLPNVGDQHEFRKLSGYVLYQERPWECRPACVCGGCNGTETVSTETITERIHWGDNSVEVVGERGSRATLVPPHGDIC